MLLDLLFECAIGPKFDCRITGTRDHLQGLPLAILIGLIFVTAKFKEVHCPDLLFVHLESVLTLLLAIVPYLNDSIYTGCGNL